MPSFHKKVFFMPHCIRFQLPRPQASLLIVLGGARGVVGLVHCSR